MRLVLVFLRHNLTHALLARVAGVCQPTVSRVIAVYTPLIAQALQDAVPTVEDLDPTGQLIIDATLLKCWDWKNHPELYSGKHHAPGMNIQVACTLSGHLAWESDPMPGATYDAAALRASGLLEVPTQDLPPGADPPRHIGDKGYTDLNMIVPKKRPPGKDLRPDDKTYNTTVNQIRYKIERVIATIKTWHTLSTGYRRPLNTLPTTLTAILGIIFTYTP